MLQSGELHLDLALVRLRALREDLQDQPGAPEHAALELALEVALLRRRELVVEDHPAGVDRLRGAPDLGDLAAAGEELRVRPRAAPANLRVAADAGALRQPQELFGGVLGGRRAEIQAHQDRRLVIERCRGAHPSFSCSPPRLMAREGTTVEMACL